MYKEGKNMLTCTLGEKVYTIPYVRAQALREIARPMEIIRRAEEPLPSPSGTPSPDRGRADDPAAFGRDLDVLVNWFCVLFGGQFTASEVYELYPADRLTHDITLAVLAVSQRISEALTAFPTTAAGRGKKAE